MTVPDFLRTLPAALGPVGRGLWQAAHGDWAAAHQTVQELATPAAWLVHAHLHREEGDLDNADYWYARAGRARSALSIEDERAALIDELGGL